MVHGNERNLRLQPGSLRCKNLRGEVGQFCSVFASEDTLGMDILNLGIEFHNFANELA